MRWCTIVLVIALAAPLAAAAPATQPTQPATQPKTQSPPTAPQLAAWFAELGDPDADVRAAAFSKLLGLSRDDLDALRAVVEAARPVSPAQGAALHDVVTHVYLSGEPLEADRESGFLGVKSLREDLEALQFGGEPALGQDGGVPVGERLPGFCGFRGLRGGDVILGVVAPRATRLARWIELREYVSRSRPGTTVTFEILRQGKVIHVPIKLDPKPIAASDRPRVDVQLNPFNVEDLIAERAARAQAYWAEVFKPLIERDVL